MTVFAFDWSVVVAVEVCELFFCSVIVDVGTSLSVTVESRVGSAFPMILADAAMYVFESLQMGAHVRNQPF